jgi:hypothetical protein
VKDVAEVSRWSVGALRSVVAEPAERSGGVPSETLSEGADRAC